MIRGSWLFGGSDKGGSLLIIGRLILLYVSTTVPFRCCTLGLFMAHLANAVGGSSTEPL